MDFTTTQEFFINMKSIPDEKSEEYDAFFQNEIDKIENGFFVNGVYIDGWLYWHTNHWNIHMDLENKNTGFIKRILGKPLLRDNEWQLAEYRLKARREKKGLCAVGSRRFSKSEIESSIIGRAATILEGSESIISAGNDKDLKLIADKIDKGLNNVHPYFKWGRIENDWKRQVTLGIKDKSGNRIPWSTILPRNLDDGKNTEAVAGVTATEFIIDEIGKFLFLRCLEAAIPAFTSPYGWRCSPLLVGTGGAFEKGSDAEKIFYNPEAYNFLAVEFGEEKKKYGLFLPGSYRMEAKVDCKLGEWLKEEKQIDIPEESELYNLNFQKSDLEKAKKIIDEERKTAKDANDQEAYLKAVMYYPYTPDECFLTASFNIFNTQAALAQKGRIFANGRTGIPVLLAHDGEKIIFEHTDALPVGSFPTKPNDNKNAPIVIYEMPMQNPPFGLYVAGVDPYRQGKSEYSDSLGAVYIYKRMHDIAGDKFQDMFVASYVARPDSKDTWHEQARLLIKFYNARTLCENDEISFIDYMKAKGDARYLERQPEWLKEVVPHSQVTREYGVHRSSQKIIDHLNNCLKRYLDQVIYQEKDEEGSIIKEVTGVTRVLDAMLLEEIIKFNDTGNFDRCFTKGAKVLCIDGYKCIENLKIGDRVLTHTGKYKNVTDIFNSVSKKDKYIIKPLGIEEFTCTENHPLLISEIKKGNGKNYFKNFTIGDLKWKEAKDINKNDYLLIPFRKDLKKCNLNWRYLYILGWYLSDGHKHKNTVRITFQGNQLHIAEYIKSLLEEVDDFSPITYSSYNHLKKDNIICKSKRKLPRIYKVKDKFAYNLEFNCTTFNNIINENISIKVGGEKIIKDPLFNSKGLLPLILGFLEGDGHQKSTKAPGSINFRETIEVSGIYTHLIKQIRRLMFDEGIWCSGNINKQKNPNSKEQYRLDIQNIEGINKILNSIPGSSKKFKNLKERSQRKNYRVIDEGIIIPIKSIDVYSSSEEVYNIEVEEDHSYTVNDIVSHNCVAASLAIAMADHLAPMGKVTTLETDPRFKYYFNKEKKQGARNLFASGFNLFTQKKNKLF